MLVWIIGAVVAAVLVVGGAAFIAGRANQGSTDSSTTTQDGLATAKRAVQAVTDQTFATVGTGSVPDGQKPTPITDTPLTSNGKPEVLYVGAEYCPYCAVERWAMLLALSRFGTFTSVGLTHSASDDVYPNTPTFSFHNAVYESQYLSFVPVELETNTKQPLDNPTAAENALMQKYDPNGGIPFINFGNTFTSSTTVSPDINQAMSGKSYDEVIQAIGDPSTDIAKGIVGSANYFTAIMCGLTGNQPTNVCTTPVITSIQSELEIKPAATSAPVATSGPTAATDPTKVG
jgi:hypothetical protein